MNKFALRRLWEIKGKIPFSALEIDGTCQFAEFCVQVQRDGNLKKQLVTVMSRMDQVANMQLLPVHKFRDITPEKDIVKEFEIKTPDLRVYMIKKEGHIIVLGGKKNTQSDDIKKFRAIKHRYLQSTKHYDY
jgi:putative component of toxin-antitoxin plasmid stabilization module